MHASLRHSRPARRAPGQTGARAVLAVVAALLGASIARAGDYHNGTTLRCNECHVMHFSQQHGYEPGGLGGFLQLGGLPQRHLLRDRANDLCLACHEGSPIAADVLGPVNTGSQPGTVRLGGYLSRWGFSPAFDTGHTLDALDPAPGSFPSWSPQNENGSGVGLLCTNCHDPHGAVASGHPTGQQYRNLRSNPGNSLRAWVTYNHQTLGSNQLTRDAFVRRVRGYDEPDMDWNEPNSSRSAIARWCGGCHTYAHGHWLGENGSGSVPPGLYPFLREHPLEGENMGSSERTQYNRHANRVKVLSQVGVWFPIGSDGTPTCISCHRAHGNGNPDGLIFRSGSGTPTEDGDSNGSTRNDLCTQCHTDGQNHD